MHQKKCSAVKLDRCLTKADEEQKENQRHKKQVFTSATHLLIGEAASREPHRFVLRKQIC